MSGLDKKANSREWEMIKKHKILLLVFITVVLIAVALTSVLQTKTSISTYTVSTPTPQPSSQAESPKPDYKFIATWEVTSVRKEKHYLWLKERPAQEQVKALIVTLHNECGNDGICDIMIWDSEDAYKARDNSSKLSDDYSKNNKTHLVGYRNSGGLFYYYGTGGDYLSAD